MKYYWIAADTMDNGKHYAFAFRVSENDNLKSRLDGVQNLNAANICQSKKQAAEIVTAWNEGYKANGSYMFADPAF